MQIFLQWDTDPLTYTDLSGAFNSSTAAVVTTEEEAYTVIAQLQKVSRLTNTYNLNVDDLEFLSNSISTMGTLNINQLPITVPSTSAVASSQDEWMRFTEWMQVRVLFDKTDSSLFDLLYFEASQSPSSEDEKKRWVEKMQDGFKNLTNDDIEVLFGDKTNHAVTASLPNKENILHFTFNDATLPITANVSKFDPGSYWRILDCLELGSALETTMESCAFIAEDILTSTVNTIAQSEVDFTIQLIKSRYDDQAWLNVLKPVSDKLRIERRNAMVAYIFGHSSN